MRREIRHSKIGRAATIAAFAITLKACAAPQTEPAMPTHAASEEKVASRNSVGALALEQGKRPRSTDKDPPKASGPLEMVVDEDGSKVKQADGSFEVVVGTETQSPDGYNTNAIVFDLDERMQEVLEKASKAKTPKEFAEIVHRELRKGARRGVKVVGMDGKPPRTSIQALAEGGDCTDLATIPITLFSMNNIPGGAYLIHFNSAPKYLFHMVPYVEHNGKKYIVDLQSFRLGHTIGGRYSIVRDLDYIQAEAFYHIEWGDYFHEKGDLANAKRAYKRAVELDSESAYAYFQLGRIYEKQGDFANTFRYMTLASRYNEKEYGDERDEAVFNFSIKLGNEAIGKATSTKKKPQQIKHLRDCVKHFRAALDSGHPIDAQTKENIEYNAQQCQAALKKYGAE